MQIYFHFLLSSYNTSNKLGHDDLLFDAGRQTEGFAGFRHSIAEEANFVDGFLTGHNV